MTDPLAHLYAEDGLDDEPDIVHTETSVEDLNRSAAEEEVLSDTDVAELALLLRNIITEGMVPDVELIELGLADLVPGDSEEADVVLTAAGRQVIAYMLAEDFPELKIAGLRG